MTTRRSFIKGLLIAAGVEAVLPAEPAAAQGVNRGQPAPSRRAGGSAYVYIDMSKKGPTDYAYTELSKKGRREAPPASDEARRPARRAAQGRRSAPHSARRNAAGAYMLETLQGHGEYIVMSAVLTSRERELARAVERARREYAARAGRRGAPKTVKGSRPTVSSPDRAKARDAGPVYRQLFYQNLSALPDNAFEIYEVFIEKKEIPARYVSRGKLDKNALHLAMMRLLLEACDLPRFGKGAVHPDVRTVRYIRREVVWKEFAARSKKGPRDRFGFAPLERAERDGLKVADYVNYALLQSRQPHPEGGNRGGGYPLIKKFVRKQVNAATLV